MHTLEITTKSTEPYRDENGDMVFPSGEEVVLTFDIENEDLQKNNKSEFIKVNETGEIAYNYLILFSENTELFPHLEVGKTLEIDEKQYKIIQKVYDQPDHKEVILLAI